MDKIGSDISSSEDELLTGESRMENNYSPIERKLPQLQQQQQEKDDDRMSLSSLSSGEQKIEEQPNLMASLPATFQGYPQYPGIYVETFIISRKKAFLKHVCFW